MSTTNRSEQHNWRSYTPSSWSWVMGWLADEYHPIFTRQANHAYARMKLALALREADTKMSSNWITAAEAVTIISKHSHHSVSAYHVRTLVNRGKIGARSSRGGTTSLKRSDVESTRVAVGTGHGHHTGRAAASSGATTGEKI
jgi:hypothetical protein